MSDDWPRRPGPSQGPSRDTGDHRSDDLGDFDDYDEYGYDYDDLPDPTGGGWSMPHSVGRPLSPPPSSSQTSWDRPQAGRFTGEPERRPGPRGSISRGRPPSSGPGLASIGPSGPRDDRDGGTPRGAWMLGVMGVLSCFGLALAYFITSGDEPGDDPVSAVSNGAAEVDESDGVGDTTGATEPGEEATSQSTEGPGVSSGPGGGPDLTGTMSSQQIVVEGAVPSTQASAGLVLLLEQVVGAGNVDESALVVDSAASMPGRIVLVAANETVFAPASEEIEASFLPVLDNVAGLMGTNQGLSMVIEGHADSDGADSMNLSLSQRRAEAVVDYLANRGGIEKIRLVAVGHGSEKPIADNSTPEGRAQNRRIEFAISGFSF